MDYLQKTTLFNNAHNKLIKRKNNSGHRVAHRLTKNLYHNYILQTHYYFCNHLYREYPCYGRPLRAQYGSCLIENERWLPVSRPSPRNWELVLSARSSHWNHQSKRQQSAQCGLFVTTNIEAHKLSHVRRCQLTSRLPTNTACHGRL